MRTSSFSVLTPVLTMVFTLGSGHLGWGLEPEGPWESFGRDQGLSGSSVTGIVQDDTGFLWLSTQSGLNRWDGYTMRVWQKQPFSQNTLSHNLIQTLYLDRGAILWLGTYGGLDRFDTSTESFTSYRHGGDQSLSHNVVTRVFRDVRGNLWVGTLDGLNRLDEATGTFRQYPFVEGRKGSLAGQTVRTLVEDGAGRLWVGSSGGLNLYDPGADTLRTFSEIFPGKAFPSGSVMAGQRLSGDRSLWFAVWGRGLVRLDPTSGDTEVHPLSDPRLYSVDLGPGGTLHVGTWGGGLVVFDPVTHEQFTFRHHPLDPHSLAHDVVYQTYQDRSGLLWVATNGGGVSRSNPRRGQFEFLATEGRVPLLAEGPEGSLWIGTYNGGVVRQTPQGQLRNWRHRSNDPSSLSNDIVNGITVVPSGDVWVSTNSGISVIDPRSGSVSRWSPADQPWALPNEVVSGLTIDDQGRWWFATYRSGLVRRSGPEPGASTKNYQAGPSSIPDNLVYFVRQDRQGRIWVGTNGGLALYRPDTDDFRVWSYRAEDVGSLPSDTVRDLLEDHRGRIWVVCNGGGLVRVDPDSGLLRSYGVAEGLTNLSAFSVLEDDSGLLWISTANGLFSFRPETETFRRYDTSDGLASAEFSSGAVKRRDGKLAFGTFRGVLTVAPERMKASEPPPSVALTSIQVLGKPRPVTSRLTLGWQENAVTFSFAALDFRAPAKNLYAYRLEGFDHQWVEAGTRREATYTNLWPGTYRFRFRGANPSEVWAESAQSVELTVEAAPWASWYAFVLYAAVLGSLVYFAQRARMSRSLGLKVTELEVLRAQLEKANDRLDRLSRLDGLTGIPNRRALDAWLAEEWARASRESLSVAVLMIDLDDFKRYNDFYGHLAGDACLKAVAQTMAAQLVRTTDFCARYGGEEFVVILHDTDLEGARTVARRLMSAVEALAIPHQMSSAAPTITLSVGLATQVPGPGHTAAELIQRADQGLYRAKALGRNRLEVH